MPRGERPLESGDSELLRFAADLRRLRENAGSPPYRELGRRAHYSAAALSEAAGGKKLPTLAVALAYVRACDGDPAAWETRWRGLQDDKPVDGESPYVGLAAFQQQDADRFFGRERLTAELAEMVRHQRFVGVFGASGSGKSSVLRAGLVPALDSRVVLFAPGARPLEECAVRLGALTGVSAVELRRDLAEDPANLHLRIRQFDENLLLVVDQFEEVFTLAPADERERFIDAITSGPRVVIGVRSDFYPHCERHAKLVEALRGSQVMVGPMSTDELRQAIVEPATAVGATVETALLARLVADASGQAAVLPLLSHALVETWRRRRGITLSLNGYVEAGGVEHAIAQTAENLYRTLSGTERIAVRHLFLRMIAVGDGPEDTKRRVTRTELAADDLLEQLAKARLVTLDRDHVELAHEALIRSWPRLQEWVDEDREGLRIHRQLTAAADTWVEHGRDPGALYRGTRLTIAKKWHTGDRGLTTREANFLAASVAEEQVGLRAAQRKDRLRRRLTGALVAVIGFGALATFGTLAAKEPADRQRARETASRVVADAMAMRKSDPAQALQLMLVANRIDPTPERRAELSQMAALTFYLRFRGPDGTIPRVEIDTAAQLSLVGGADRAHWALFDLRDGDWREIRGEPTGPTGQAVLAERAEQVRRMPVSEDEIGGMTRRICEIARPALTRDQWAARFTVEPYEPPCPS